MEHTAINTAAAVPAAFSCTVAAEALLPALKRAATVIDRRNSIPILSTVLLSVDRDTLEVSATDLDVMLIERLPCQDGADGGAVAVGAFALLDFVKRLPKGSQVELVANGDMLAIAAGRVRSKMPTLRADDFPLIAEKAWQGTFDAPAAQLRHDLARVRFAVSTEEMRYYLRGIYLETDAEAGEIAAVATDGHRLARVRRPLPPTFAECKGGIVPVKPIDCLLRIIGRNPDPAATVDVAMAPTMIQFSLGGDAIVLRSKLIDGSFPDYRRVIPKHNYERLTFSTAGLAPMLKARAETPAAGRFAAKDKAAALHMSEGGLVLSKANGDAAVTVAGAAYSGKMMTVCFNAGYLGDVLDALGDDVAEAEFADPKAPIRIVGASSPELDIVLMPLRRDAPKTLTPADVGAAGDAPKPSLFAAWPAMPGRAADLSDVERAGVDRSQDGIGGKFSTKTIGLDPGPRQATRAEQEAYARDLAKRAGLPAFDDVTIGDRVATFGRVTCEAVDATVEHVDFETLTVTTRVEQRPAQYENGAYSIAFPGRIRAAVTMETLGDDGEPVACQTLRADVKGALPVAAVDVLAASGLEPVKQTRRRKAKPVTAARGDIKPAERVDADPVCGEAGVHIEAEAQPGAASEGDFAATEDVPPDYVEETPESAWVCNPDYGIDDAPADSGNECRNMSEVMPAPAATESEKLTSMSTDALGEILAELKALRAEVAELRSLSDLAAPSEADKSDAHAAQTTATLTREIERLKRENDLLVQDREYYERKNNERRARLITLKASRRRTAATLRRMRSRLDLHSRALDAANSANATLRAELEETRRRADEAEAAERRALVECQAANARAIDAEHKVAELRLERLPTLRPMQPVDGYRSHGAILLAA